MKKQYKYKAPIFIVIVFSLILIWITYDIISETPEKDFFNIDFEESFDEISAYGSLIGGIATFMSVLLLVYTIFTQIEQLNSQRQQFEKRVKIDEFNNKFNLLNQLKIVNLYLKTQYQI